MSLWNLILSDRWTLGFVRLAVLLLAVYAIASVVALITAGRWIKGFGTAGLSADDDIAPVAAARSELMEAKDLAERIKVELRKRRE